MVSHERDDSRQLFLTVWQKYQSQQPLEPLEQNILQIMLEHPEYHAAFNQPESLQTKEFHPELGEVNPFLHLGLHLALREQIAIDQPAGITTIYQQLLQRHQGDVLTTEHQMMEPLTQWIWSALNNPTTANTEHYLEQLRRL
ncbi:MAG: DUF1841 family protein [Legionellales bacterium]|nr:DUF1841 family protein [Legionellales bacterium]